ncbi:uncharacterized protein BCR38DRAFT_490370 [Pseudomassariella vexata]|uniref:Uncharacterized protein n=1 Tax=Pseudomassariella vexata TaxID=1141098 RepID=A0A1Y2DCD1_9PEZI|nr:uncharacterized protein BCR38DRAFT_490370 [Pseudomassariella vexata]ORY56930.1 hypothetical protein BCR38DRAFT_490370 [Pseudomassariella vexata]
MSNYAESVVESAGTGCNNGTAHREPSEQTPMARQTWNDSSHAQRPEPGSPQRPVASPKTTDPLPTGSRFDPSDRVRQKMRNEGLAGLVPEGRQSWASSYTLSEPIRKPKQSWLARLTRRCKAKKPPPTDFFASSSRSSLARPASVSPAPGKWWGASGSVLSVKPQKKRAIFSRWTSKRRRRAACWGNQEEEEEDEGVYTSSCSSSLAPSGTWKRSLLASFVISDR